MLHSSSLINNKYRISNKFECLEDVRKDAILDDTAVLVPVFSVLVSAALLVSHVPVNQQTQEVDGVEVRQNVVES